MDAPAPTKAPARLNLNKRERRRMLASIRRWWRRSIVNSVDQDEVLARLRDDSRATGRYIFMTLMAAGIAILGMLLGSPAVVIGAMLLSPLMGPIIGSGFALAVGDAVWLRKCARVLAIGTLVAVAIAALIVAMSPLQTVTPEIAARTRPNLFDLGVALFSALAGSYATVRGREGIIVGVAIAIALIPPLAAIGFGVATLNLTVFVGALMLLITNLMAISLASAVMARFYGFHSTLTRQQSRIQNVGIIVAFTLLAIPLAISLRQIAWEANATRQISTVIKQQFAAKSRLSQIDIDYDARPISVTASVLTPEFRHGAEANSGRALVRLLRRPVAVSIDQYQVGTDPGEAEAAQLAAARDKQQAEATERQIAELGHRLALVAGVAPDAVIIDREHRRALVTARPIEGATLAAYRMFERRVAAGVPGWSVELRPPARPLPDIPLDGDTPDAARLDLVAWAARRVAAPIEVGGRPEAVAAVRAALAERGVTETIAVRASDDTVRIRWAAPDKVGN